MDEPRITGVMRASDGPAYSPQEVPDGINMTLEEWAALSDFQRELVGNRRFVGEHAMPLPPKDDPR